MHKYFMFVFLTISSLAMYASDNPTAEKPDEITFHDLIETLNGLPKRWLDAWVVGSSQYAMRVGHLISMMNATVGQQPISPDAPEQWILCKERLEEQQDGKVPLYATLNNVGKQDTRIGILPYTAATIVATVEKERTARLQKAKEKQSAGN